MAFQETVRVRYQSMLDEIRSSGLFKNERIILDPQGAEITVTLDPATGPRNVINLCSNNYLGLSSHPAVLRAAHAAIDARGYGMSSVRFICGTQDIHKELESALSDFLGTEATILFSSCFDANAAVFEALLDEESIMLSDRLVHASLIDGMRLSKAQHDTYKHSDMAHLRTKLEMYKDRPRKMIITDGVFSMDGDIAPLDDIVRLAEEFGAMVCVDDSHATGFLGPTGKGTHELRGVLGKIDLVTTTFGKALGGASGGCVSGRKELVEMLRQRGRPYLFSNTLSPVITATTLEVLKLLTAHNDQRERLWENTRYWRTGLTEAGFLLKPGDSPIVPVMLYNAKLSQDFSAGLFDHGVYAVGFFFPVVAKGQARIRTQLSAAHTRPQLDQALTAFVDVGNRLGVLGLTQEQIMEQFGT
jgi:glycine C-acetyltransferase